MPKPRSCKPIEIPSCPPDPRGIRVIIVRRGSRLSGPPSEQDDARFHTQKPPGVAQSPGWDDDLSRAIAA